MYSKSNHPLVDWLTYFSYEYQREKFPHIKYYRWRKIFADAIAYEEIFENKKKGVKHESEQ